LRQTHPALANFLAGGWFGMFIPSSTPAALQKRIHEDVQAALETPAVHEGLVKAGVDPRLMTQAEWAAYLQADLDRWRPVFRERNIHLD